MGYCMRCRTLFDRRRAGELICYIPSKTTEYRLCDECKSVVENVKKSNSLGEDFSVRATNCLIRLGIRDLADLASYNIPEINLRCVSGIGYKTASEIIEMRDVYLSAFWQCSLCSTRNNGETDICSQCLKGRELLPLFYVKQLLQRIQELENPPNPS